MKFLFGLIVAAVGRVLFRKMADGAGPRATPRVSTPATDAGAATPSKQPEFGVREVRRNGSTITIETRDFENVSVRDLRDVHSGEVGIQGHALFVEDKNEHVSDVYRLLREPDNKNDANAVAVYSGPRKIGFLSESKAASYAKELDRLGADSFLVGGVARDSAKLLLELPSLPAIRKLR